MIVLKVILGFVCIAWAAPGLVYWIGVKRVGRSMRWRYGDSVQRFYACLLVMVVIAAFVPFLAFLPGNVRLFAALLGVLVTAILALAGWFLAINMVTEIQQMRRRALGQCEECGYLLRGNVSGVCPECGTENAHGLPTR